MFTMVCCALTTPQVFLKLNSQPFQQSKAIFNGLLVEKAVSQHWSCVKQLLYLVNICDLQKVYMEKCFPTYWGKLGYPGAAMEQKICFTH